MQNVGLCSSQESDDKQRNACLFSTMGLQRVTKLVLQTIWIDSVCLGKGERLFKLVYLKDLEFCFFVFF